MYVKESEAMKLTCYRTIDATHEGKPCEGVKCSAWSPIDWKMTPCPHCHKQIDALQADGETWGKCSAKWR